MNNLTEPFFIIVIIIIIVIIMSVMFVLLLKRDILLQRNSNRYFMPKKHCAKKVNKLESNFFIFHAGLLVGLHLFLLTLALPSFGYSNTVGYLCGFDSLCFCLVRK